MKLNKLTQAVLAGSIAASGAAIADDKESSFAVSGNVTIATDYVFRGISQTDEGPAIQGGFDIEHASGLYAGIWASNVDFGTDGQTEFDYYGGFAGDLTEDVGFDVGVLYFDYPQASEGANGQQNFVEYYGSLSMAGATVGWNYSPDFFLSAGPSNYWYADYGFDLGSGVGLGLHYGHQQWSGSNILGASSSNDEYDEWSVGLSKDVAGVSLGLNYHDTNLSSTACSFFMATANGDDLCKSRVVFTVSKSM